MTGIKLAKLPDRTPVKLTISLAPDLLQALACYQAFSRGLAARILASLSMTISRTTFGDHAGCGGVGTNVAETSC